MSPLTEAYNESFHSGNHITSEAIAKAADAPLHLVFLINQIVETRLQPYREMVVRLVKEAEDANTALDQAYIRANDLEDEIAALKQTLVTTHRLRHIFQHHHVQAQHQLL